MCFACASQTFCLTNFPSPISASDHTQVNAPFTVGCFGPVTSLTQCKNLYPTCGTGFVTYNVTINGKTGVYKNYDTNCPCFKMGTESYNQVTYY